MAQAESAITVVTGPVVGYVDGNSARILVEVDHTAVLTCQLIPDKQKSDVTANGDTQSPVQFSSTVEFREGRPGVFTFTGLTQATYYRAVIGEVQSHVPCGFKTICVEPDYELRVAALSCNDIKIVDTIPENEDLWSVLRERVLDRQIDMLLHLGDQVYADSQMHDVEDGQVELKDVNCKFLHGMDLLEGLSPADWHEHYEAICELYRDAYRETWAHPPTRAVLANVPNVMIMDDHEIRDDWGDKASDRDQDTMEFFVARCGYRAFCEYQGQLQWDCLEDFMTSKQHRIFKIGSHTGVVLADMRAARTFNYQQNDPNVVLGTPQWEEIDNALADDGVLADCDTLIFGTGVPLVFMTTGITDFLGASVSKLDDMLGHWSSEAHLPCQKKVMQRLECWKSRDPQRELVLIGGDVHCGGFTSLWCDKGERHVALGVQMFTSSIGNKCFSNFMMKGISMLGGASATEVESLGNGFSFQHHSWTAKRNYGLIKIQPTGTDQHEHNKERVNRCRCTLVQSCEAEKAIEESETNFMPIDQARSRSCCMVTGEPEVDDHEIRDDLSDGTSHEAAEQVLLEVQVVDAQGRRRGKPSPSPRDAAAKEERGSCACFL